tara:strand:- start:811 stop:2733 length:1923 start_codon:yes stop_codon:yes gene_type:complete
MGGGLMQLVAYGAQDIYLTGNPQITFFKVVYRRHTNFSMEAIQQTLAGSAAANSTQNCTISRNGDLIHNVWIEDTNGTSAEGIIYDYIKRVDCEIGGQLIDRQTGDWNAVWWNLTTPESKVNGLRNAFIGRTGADTSNCFYYPLNFWFCRNIGLALPLIALQYHEVNLKITYATNSVVNSPKVWIDYIYLDTDERRRFAQVSHEYLIEQVQRDTFRGDQKIYDLNFNHPVKELLFLNDATATSSESSCMFAPIRTTGNIITSSANQVYSNSDNTSMRLVLNGHDRFTKRKMKYFKTCQILQHHTRCPAIGENFTTVCNFSSGLKILDTQIPNVSDENSSSTIVVPFDCKLINVRTQLLNTAIGSADATLTIKKFANNTASSASATLSTALTITNGTAVNGTTLFQIDENASSTFTQGELIEITTDGASSGSAPLNVSYEFQTGGLNCSGQNIFYVEKPVRLISATMTTTTKTYDESVEIALTVDSGPSNSVEAVVNTTRITPRITLDGKNAKQGFILSAISNESLCIQGGKSIGIRTLTDDGGNDRSLPYAEGFVTLELEELPLLISGDSNNLGNIYCYSFALKPEEHQPSGTCNFSRIDSSQLIFDDNPGDSSTTLKVFAINYNILRIMSGMGGLAYSN